MYVPLSFLWCKSHFKLEMHWETGQMTAVRAWKSPSCLTKCLMTGRPLFPLAAADKSCHRCAILPTRLREEGRLCGCWAWHCPRCYFSWPPGLEAGFVNKPLWLWLSCSSRAALVPAVNQSRNTDPTSDAFFKTNHFPAHTSPLLM